MTPGEHVIAFRYGDDVDALMRELDRLHGLDAALLILRVSALLAPDELRRLINRLERVLV